MRHVQTVLSSGRSVMGMDSVHDHVKKCASTTIVPSNDRIKVNDRFCTDEMTAMGVSAFTSYCVHRISCYLPRNWGILFMTDAGTYQHIYSDTSANEDNSFRNHIR